MPGIPSIDWIPTPRTPTLRTVRRPRPLLGRCNCFKVDEPRMRENMKSTLGWAAIGVGAMSLATVAGCASVPGPNAKVASSEAAIRAAQESGSKGVPQAALHLKLAEEQLLSAKASIRDNENERAEYILMRTQADAELAIALSHVAASNVQAGTAVDEARAVRSGSPTP